MTDSTFSLEWYDPELILLVVYPEHVGQKLLIESLNGLNSHLDAAKQPLHLIVDSRKIKTLNLGAMTKIPEMIRFMTHKNLGWTAMVGLNPAIGFWLKVVLKVFNFRYNAFPTIEEGAQFLRDVNRIHGTQVQ